MQSAEYKLNAFESMFFCQASSNVLGAQMGASAFEKLPATPLCTSRTPASAQTLRKAKRDPSQQRVAWNKAALGRLLLSQKKRRKAIGSWEKVEKLDQKGMALDFLSSSQAYEVLKKILICF